MLPRRHGFGTGTTAPRNPDRQPGSRYRIRAGHGALVVNRWAGRPTTGWTLDWYNVELRDDGFPYGALLYRDNTNPRRGVRVGIQWRHDIEQLDAIALHETDPRPADNAPDAVLRDLERDARGRLGSLLTIYTAVAAYLATGEAETTILDAAGLSSDG